MGMLQQGLRPAEVARLLGVSRQAVSQWKAAYLRGGPEALAAKPPPGNQRKLQRHQLQQLEQILLEGQRSGGYQYLWSPRYIDAPILRDTLTSDGIGIVTAQRVFYLADANYNTTGLVKYDSGNGQWQVVERYSYTPYGQVTYRTADWTETTGSTNGNTVLYTGRTLDALTGLYYYRARYYDPVLECFISRDPIDSEPNLHRYVLSNPVLLLDARGMSYEESCISNCLKTCDEEFDWWNPQRYICRAYCDNTCTNTPDSWDLLYRLCPAVRAASTVLTCPCAMLQVADNIPGVGQDPLVVYLDAGCGALTAASSLCDAMERGRVLD